MSAARLSTGWSKQEHDFTLQPVRVPELVDDEHRRCTRRAGRLAGARRGLDDEGAVEVFEKSNAPSLCRSSGQHRAVIKALRLRLAESSYE
ncbi:MAG: hypothetical protein Q8N26_28680 [Myxococcales bacterium]|nr:hypothetical protein [Myxococcales bacterium]